MYKIVGVDGKEYGPVSLDQLKQWAGEGRLTAQTRIQDTATGQWKTAAEVPELSALLAARSASAPSPMRPATIAAAQAAGQQTGLATASLVLGICSFFTCLLTAIPAIICGHIAHARARRFPAQYGGAGKATAGLVMGYISVAAIPIVAILAAMLLPALAKAKERAQSINCVNNMKQIGLAFRTWEMDHTNAFPFNVTSESGGTHELVSLDADGFDRNSFSHFLVMSNELSTPGVLVCPADTSKQRASSWENVQAGNVSYKVHADANVSSANPQQVLAVCPIHGNTLYCDGSVQRNQRSSRTRSSSSPGGSAPGNR